MLAQRPADLSELRGSFALVWRDGEDVRLARSLDRPLRYFLAKEASGPALIVAERIDQIKDCLEELGYLDQFHPSYTRMVPAHHTHQASADWLPGSQPPTRALLLTAQGRIAPQISISSASVTSKRFATKCVPGSRSRTTRSQLGFVSRVGSTVVRF